MMRELEAEMAGQDGGRRAHSRDPGRFVRDRGYFVIACRGPAVLGCGGYRPLDCDCAEIGSFFVRTSARGRGVGHRILRHLETEIRRHGYMTAVLDLDGGRADLLEKFEAEGYTPIPPFLNHVGNPRSCCLAKRVGPAAAKAPRN